mgnify:CR=1 FL=1
MAQNGFPLLALADWRATRDTLHGYARVLGTIRGTLTPKQKHWWHISLRVTPGGITTTRIPNRETGFELRLELSTHGLVIHSLLSRRLSRAPGLVLPPRIANTSVTVVEGGVSPLATLIDCTAHLAGAPVDDPLALSGG